MTLDSDTRRRIIEQLRGARGERPVPSGGHPSTGGVFAALLEGRARIVDCFDDGRRRFVVLEATPAGEPLSARERSVVLALAVELSNKVAALELSISQATASAHVASALRKLGVDRLTLLRALAVIADWLAPAELAA